MAAAVGTVLYRQRPRCMTKKYSKLLKGIIKSSMSIMACDWSKVLKLELRLCSGSILRDIFFGDEAISRKINNIKYSMNLQVND